MVLWWNHAASQTATGRRRRPSFVEAQCLWERNSPQVHLIPLPHTPFPVWSHFSFHFFHFFFKRKAHFPPTHLNALSSVCKSIFSRDLCSCILMKHTAPVCKCFTQSAILLPPLLCRLISAAQMDLNGHILSPIKGTNGYAIPAGCLQSIFSKHKLAENHCSISFFCVVLDSLKTSGHVSLSV